MMRSCVGCDERVAHGIRSSTRPIRPALTASGSCRRRSAEALMLRFCSKRWPLSTSSSSWCWSSPSMYSPSSTSINALPSADAMTRRAMRSRS